MEGIEHFTTTIIQLFSGHTELASVIHHFQWDDWYTFGDPVSPDDVNWNTEQDRLYDHYYQEYLKHHITAEQFDTFRGEMMQVDAAQHQIHQIQIHGSYGYKDMPTVKSLTSDINSTLTRWRF